MNWAEEYAKKMIEKYPNLEEFTIASGVSPSGFIHIGNFREIVTTFFVGHELKKLGKKVRYILSFDDFDRFRKVPVGIDPTFEKYVGMPYSSIPSPLGTDKTYAEEFEGIFANELAKMGIIPEFIYQTAEYKSGRYIEQIKVAMEKRLEIFDILDKYKTQDFSDEERNAYYPISIYCDDCGKDFTTVNSYDVNTGDIHYSCKCGNTHKINVNTAKNIKLVWKVDWPMRWAIEEVIFEPGGRDHSAANGSYVVGKEIAKKIYNFEAPNYIAYDFIGIKGVEGKMSSSTGKVLTLTDLLQVYDKNLILWFYGKYKPNSEFQIALDNDVIRYYTEFDRMVKAYFQGALDEKNTSIISLTDVTADYVNYPNFSYLATFLPMVNYNEEYLKVFLKKEQIDCDSTYYDERLEKAKYWLETYGEAYRIELVSAPQEEFYNQLSDMEKAWVYATVELLEQEFENSDDLQTALYAVVKKYYSDPTELKLHQKRYFQIIYRLLLGTDKGPKMGMFLQALSKESLFKLLVFKKKVENLVEHEAHL